MEKQYYSDRLEALISNLHDIAQFFASATVTHYFLAEGYMVELELLRDEFKTLEKDIISFNSSESVETQKVKLEKQSKSINSTLVTIRGKFAKLKEEHVGSCKQTSSQNIGQGYTQLPPIQLKQFSGVIDEWSEFINLFDTTVHQNSGLTDIQKFLYLKSHLKGEALSTISNFQLDGSQYISAYTTLRERYDNRRRNASYYLNQILQFNVTTPKFTLQQFLQVHKNAVSGFTNTGLNDPLDFIQMTLVYNNLNTKMQKEFDLNSSEIPTLTELFKYLELHSKSEELRSDSSTNQKKSFLQSKINTTSHSNNDNNKNNNTATYVCNCCKTDNHRLYFCPKFLKMNVNQRQDYVRRNSICFLCLQYRTKDHKCNLKNCKHCAMKHNTLLCKQSTRPNSPVGAGSPDKEPVKPVQDDTCNEQVKPTLMTNNNKSVLLGTAYVYVKGQDGQLHGAVAVVDPGSMSSLVEAKFAEKLQLPIQTTSGCITGVGEQLTQVKGSVQLQFKSRFINTKLRLITADVVPTITSPLPNVPLSNDLLYKFAGINLADKFFTTTKNIQLLLGADVFSQIISHNKNAVIPGEPLGLQTELGVLVIGEVPQQYNVKVQSRHALLCCKTTSHIDECLQSFWESEEIDMDSVKVDDPSVVRAENIFVNTTVRNEDGRYIVNLPFKQDDINLGSNMDYAVKNFIRLEKRLEKDDTMKSLYHSFIAEYQALGHMKPAASEVDYIHPQELVYRPDKSSTKLRVVFNASNKSDTGQSLNDLLLPGPALQKQLTHILIMFRLHQVTLCADIKKMFRQILVTQDHQSYQQILYRSSPRQQLQQMTLLTVVYGQASSPYLSLRVLQHLAETYQEKYPLAAYAILNHFFVDDCVSGASTIEEAQNLKQQLIAIFEEGKFELSKWCSNNPELLSEFKSEQLEPLVSFDNSLTGIKVLGLIYNPTQDSFHYKITPFTGKITKRTVLSFVSKIFDCLGLISPITFFIKSFLQQLWLEKLDWDHKPSHQLCQQWSKFAASLEELPTLSIPRHIINQNCILRLISFSDASEMGYCAVIYIQSERDDQFYSNILISKTKVASLSKKLSIPKLELMAAILSVKLMKHVLQSSIANKIHEIYYFSDSQIVLSWLKTPPYKLKTFVANRVSFIQQHTKQNKWMHVETKQNPADIGTRPILPADLVTNKLWFEGPSFLHQPPTMWTPGSQLQPDNLPELKTDMSKVTLLARKPENDDMYETIEKFSNFNRLVRCYAYVWRFYTNCKLGRAKKNCSPLTVEEIRHSTTTIIKIVQSHHFGSDLLLAGENKQICKLSPFIDDEGVLRARGRLVHAPLPAMSKYPVILVKNCHLSRLIVRHYHENNFHPNVKLMQALISVRYHILGVRQLVKDVVFKCPRCTKFAHRSLQPMMGDLPPSRFTTIRPFYHSFVDYAGPFSVKENKLKKPRITKGYLCVFVCMSVKAVHLEFVTELTTAAFLAAFTRFVARRSLPAKMFSDNGSNFCGAAKQLHELAKFLKDNHDTILSSLASREVSWSFSPPYASNMNGLVEAAVKSAKTLLYKQIGQSTLTYEEYCTLFCRIEMILNSRPLVLQTSETDPDYLSPAHFLVGQNFTAVPEQGIPEEITLKCRYQRINQMAQGFWRRWSRDYLNTLIQRQKWQQQPSQPPQLGQLVYLVQMNTSPLSWPLGKIVKLHPGPDGISRVVTVKSDQSVYVRPINKLVFLNS